MKPSIHQALVLSLSALLLVSGCDRRGRAPVKPSNNNKTQTTSGNTSATNSNGNTTSTIADSKTTTTNPTTNSTTTTTTTDSKVSTTEPSVDLGATNESKLVEDAQIDKSCADQTIDENESASKQAFIKDLSTMNTFAGCIGTAGISLDCHPSDNANSRCDDVPADKRVYSLHTDADSPAKAKYLELAKTKDDDQAETIMTARAKLAILRYSKMGVKYSDERLKGSDVSATEEILDPTSQKPVRIQPVLLNLSNSAKAIQDALPGIQSMARTVNGADSDDATNAQKYLKTLQKFE